MDIYGVLRVDNVREYGGTLSMPQYLKFAIDYNRAVELMEECKKNEPYEFGVTKEFDVVKQDTNRPYFQEHIWNRWFKLDLEGANVVHMKLSQLNELTGILAPDLLKSAVGSDGKTYTIVALDFNSLSCAVFVEDAKEAAHD